jgi:hypothetical protein
MNAFLKKFLISLVFLLLSIPLSALLWNGLETDVHGAYLARCHSLNGSPDPRCTPGTVFKKVTAKDVCKRGYASHVRNVSVSKKRRVYAMYGLKYPQPPKTYVLDHRASFLLGGTNALRNLFPQPYKLSLEKDKVENALHRQVCLGKITLKEAQERIVRWSEAEKK